MSAPRTLAILILAPALAFAAGTKGEAKPAAAAPAPASTPAPAPAPTPAAPAAEKPAAPEKPASAPSEEEIRREVDQKVEAAKKELREEIRAQAATQSVAQGWQEEWTEEKRKLELLTMDGYFRVRPDLFHNFDLRRIPDPSGYTVFPLSSASAAEHTMAGVNMRLRIEPTINVSEEVRLRMQIDGLDNVIMGSTPDYAFTRSEYADLPFLSESQSPVNVATALKDSIVLKRVFGEVTTPVGVLRFGRMGSQWGLGMVHSDGSCIDCDFGDTVDRIQFVTQPLPGIYVTPMIDFNSEGPSSSILNEAGGQPVDLSQSDDAHSYVLAVAKRDTDQQVKAKLENNQMVLNGGLHLTYRTQHSEPLGWTPGSSTGLDYQVRNAWLVIPDLWGKYEQKNLRVEVEVAARIGGISSVAGLHGLSDAIQSPLRILEFGGVAQGEYRLLNDKLKLRGELGFASGDSAPGMGARPNRPGFPQQGDFDGPQWNCSPNGGCDDQNIRNFTFNRDYRIDLILWRELIGTITDAAYVKPSADYELADGLHLIGAMIYSRAIYAESTPAYDGSGNTDASLGVEFDGGVQYETEDGFYAQVQGGILFPLGGFNNPSIAGQAPVALESATAFRALVGVRF